MLLGIRKSSSSLVEELKATRTRERSGVEMQAEIVNYLKDLTSERTASADDILANLDIDLLGRHNRVTSMLRSNPKVDFIENRDKIFKIKYRTKFELRNKEELLNMIDRLKYGIPQSDVENCYEGVVDDIKMCIVSGQIIASKYKDGSSKDFILYPRDKPFYVTLSGDVIAMHESDSITTTVDITKEIRRGDAIMVGNDDNWFRVDCSIDKGRAQQPERAKPPLSASSVQDLPSRNEYFKPFTDTVLPLSHSYIDASLENASGYGSSIGRSRKVTCKAIKHGCTNDIRQLWEQTTEDLKPFQSTISEEFDRNIENYLLKEGLIQQRGLSVRKNANSASSTGPAQKKMRKQYKARQSSRPSNMHLAGTELGALLGISLEAPKK